jgi:hypothetical protein
VESLPKKRLVEEFPLIKVEHEDVIEDDINNK